MTLQYAKTIRKKLRELSGLAHERELSMECREKKGRKVASLGYIVKIQSLTLDHHVLLIQENWRCQ